MTRRTEVGFTLIELAIAVVILVLLMMLAVPSMNGVLADRRLRPFARRVQRGCPRSSRTQRHRAASLFDFLA